MPTLAMSDAAGMSNHRRYDTVSLDAGYTLIYPVREAPEIVADILAEHGINPTREQLMAAWQRAERLFLADYLAPQSMTWTADRLIWQLYERYYAQWLGDLGVEDTDGTHARAIIDTYNDPENWITYEGVSAALVELRARGYRLGIVSDWVSSLPRILRRLGLLRYLDWVLVSAAIGFNKPSPALYRLAVQRARTPVERMVHVGDSYYADVRGARTVGMDAIMIDWRRRTWPPLDVPLIHSLDELPPLLERL